MFSKNKKVQSKDAPAIVRSKPAAPSIISADLKIEGNLNSKGEIQVDGTVRGNITTKKLLVGETADVRGDTIADYVQVFGKINGQIKAREVVLAKTAHVVGDILHENLSIEPGAFLEGLCKRISDTELADVVKPGVAKSESTAPSAVKPIFATDSSKASSA